MRNSFVCFDIVDLYAATLKLNIHGHIL